MDNEKELQTKIEHTNARERGDNVYCWLACKKPKTHNEVTFKFVMWKVFLRS